MKITDTLIAAYVDGELPLEERAAVEAAAKGDADVAERLRSHLRVRARVAGAFAAALDEPAPAELLATIAGSRAAPDNVISLAKAREQRAPPAAPERSRWLAWGAVAACVAVAAVVAQGSFTPVAGPMIAYGP